MKTFVAIRTRTVLYELLKLDINKATGPDRIGALILRELASEIAIPLAIICRRLLREGVWPVLSLFTNVVLSIALQIIVECISHV